MAEWQRRATRKVGPLGLCVCALLLTAAAGADSAHAQSAPAVALASVPFRPEPPLRSYVAIRRLESANERHHKEAWLVARTELRDDGTFAYQVLSEGGSELIRKRVLREALEREGQVHQDGRSRRGGLTLDNYAFSTPRVVGAALRVEIEPRRREDMLLKGALLMSPDGELLRVEGDLVKRPSFWTRSVHLVREYGRVAGTHVPLRLETTAQVRIVGPSTFTMTYVYERINGRPVQAEPLVPSSLGRLAARAPQ